MKRFKVVVIGASAGGLDALSIILGYLPKTVLFPVIFAHELPLLSPPRFRLAQLQIAKPLVFDRTTK